MTDNIPFLDQATVTSTERLCFMILGHLQKQEDDLAAFREEVLQAKRAEKFHEVMNYVEDYVDKSDYGSIQGGDCEQLAMCVCVENIPLERVKDIFRRVFPNKTVPKYKTVPEDEKESLCYTVYHIDNDASCVEWESQSNAIKAVSFSEQDIKSLLSEMTMVEIANIVPKISGVSSEFV